MDKAFDLYSPDLVSRIIQQLEPLLKEVDQELPTSGFLSGGAVANTILSLITGNSYPVNDIDIFTFTSVVKNKYAGGNPTHSFYFAAESTKPFSATVTILSTERIKLLNIVNFSVSIKPPNTQKEKSEEAESLSTEYKILLGTFDFNCIQVGINLANKELIFTSEFEEFLTTRQLEINSIASPCSTILRIFKKADELDIYVDFDKCAKLLSYALHISYSPYSVVHQSLVDVNKLVIYERYKEKIEEYFSLEENKHMARVRGTSFDIEVNTYKFKPIKYNLEIYNQEPICLRSVTETTALRNIWFYLYETGVNTYKRSLAIDVGNHNHLANFMSRRRDYITPGIELSRLAQLNSFLDTHSSLVQLFSSLNLGQQIACMKFINKLTKLYGYWVIGEIENLAIPMEYIVSENLTAIAESVTPKLKELQKVIGLEIDLSSFIRHSEVVLLNTKELLMSEGTRMSHCVGGYSRSIENKDSIILSLRPKDGKPTTCQFGLRQILAHKAVTENSSVSIRREIEKIQKVFTYVFTLLQHRGFANEQPADENKKLADELLEYLNTEIAPRLSSDKSLKSSRNVDVDNLLLAF